MNDFIGRSKELQLLEERWNSRESEFLVLYGRRRVGKTELIRHFSKAKRLLFAVGTRSDARSQIRHFMESVAALAQEPDLATLPVQDWDTALARLDVALRKRSGKTLLVMDEFPWMVDASPELPSLLQKWWDTRWAKNKSVFLLLCGSYLGFMEREVLSEKSPLFGRRTAVLQLKPLTFSDSRRFHVSVSLKEQIKRYLLCGGIPAYHKLFRSPSSLSEQMIRAFFEPDAPLAKEADFLLMEELKEPKLYFSLLESLGDTRKGVSELAQSLGVERSRIPYYTKNLMALHYVEKHSPFLRYHDLSERKGVYRIADPLLRFWFAFVYPHTSLIERLDTRVFYSTVVAPRLDAYWGHAFEELAAELFLEKKLLPKLAEPFKLGAYWDKTTQLDFVIALKSGIAYVGECRWGALDKAQVLAFQKKIAAMPDQESLHPVMVTAEKVSLSLKRHPGISIHAISEFV